VKYSIFIHIHIVWSIIYRCKPFVGGLIGFVIDESKCVIGIFSIVMFV